MSSVYMMNNNGNTEGRKCTSRSIKRENLNFSLIPNTTDNQRNQPIRAALIYFPLREETFIENDIPLKKEI